MRWRKKNNWIIRLIPFCIHRKKHSVRFRFLFYFCDCVQFYLSKIGHLKPIYFPFWQYSTYDFFSRSHGFDLTRPPSPTNHYHHHHHAYKYVWICILLGIHFFRCCVEIVSFWVLCRVFFPRHPLCIYPCTLYSIVYHSLFEHFEIIPPPSVFVFCIFIFTKPETIFANRNRIQPNLPLRTILYVYIVFSVFFVCFIFIFYIYIYTLNRNESISLYVYVSRAKYVSIYLFFWFLFVQICFHILFVVFVRICYSYYFNIQINIKTIKKNHQIQAIIQASGIIRCLCIIFKKWKGKIK